VISQISIKDFQSIAKADLELGRFTVVVGPSSSGKSALLRAIRLLANNGRGHAFVRQGQRTTTVSAQVGEAQVTLTRGDGVGEYRISRGGQVAVFTKLGGSVPQEVGAVLGIEPKDALHFAGQFDRPFLLDETGAEVARVLGDLTKVSLIFAAAREASRRRGGVNARLRTRESDLGRLRADLVRFKDLPAKVAAQGKAETALALVRELQGRLGLLDSLSTDLQVAAVAQGQAEAALGAPVGDFGPVQASWDAFDRFRSLVVEINAYQRAGAVLEVEAVEAGQEIERLEAEYHELLSEAGTCPVCGQSTKELQSV
jgi:exonuclease SbcC